MNPFIEFSLLIAAAACVSFVMRLIKQPLIIGHIVTGLIVGPLFLKLINTTETLTLFSEIGIAILLFLVGLHLHPKAVREFGGISIVTGIGQVVFTSVVGFLIAIGLGIETIPAIYIGIALAFSSTIIILKLISDRGDIDNLYGRISIGFLLVQDLIAILILFLLPLIAAGNLTPTDIFMMFLKGTGLLIFMYVVSRFIIPRLGTFLAKSQELLFLFTIAWGLGISSLFYVFGFGIESGALIAGISLATLPSRHEVSARLTPLRDFFIIMFFILLGAQMDFGNISTILPQALVFSVLILIGNPLILMSIMGMLGYKKKTSLQTGFTVAQISEFSLILIAIGLRLGHLDESIVSLVTLVGLITIFGSTYMITYSDTIYRWLEKYLSIFERKRILEKDLGGKTHNVILLGANRVGFSFIRELEKQKENFLVIDHDPEIVSKFHHKEIDALYGDAGDITFLESLNFNDAHTIISTIPDSDVNAMIVNIAHTHNPASVIMVTAQRNREASHLYNEGADYVIMPHFLGSEQATAIMVKNKQNKEKYTTLRNKHLEELKERDEEGQEHP
jgi:Kef-type K+ transport system membrane component KefB/Trk K+ transport system NAD-binding subunit